MKAKPGGICTQLFRCPKCEEPMYQPPGATVEHYCKTARQVVELKPVK